MRHAGERKVQSWLVCLSFFCPPSVQFYCRCCDLAPAPYARPRTCTPLNTCVCSGIDCLLFGPWPKDTVADQTHTHTQKKPHLVFTRTHEQTNFIKAHASYPYYLDKSIHHVRAWLSVNIAFCCVWWLCVHGEDMRIARWSLALLGRDGIG